MSQKRKIYTLNNLPPEVVAVTFAKCSRSPKSFQEIAQELTKKSSAQFHEKWVVGYGHSSIAEHAVISLAIENVSILSSKIIEDNRLASYTEKSTRYQIFDKNKYYKPESIIKSNLGKLYQNTCNYLMKTYLNLFPTLTDFIKQKYPKKSNISEQLYNSQIKAKVCDNLRYLLPAATLTNLGMTVNARSLEHAIVKMLSHPLKELQEIGQEMKKAALKVVPTLIKYTNPSPYLIQTNATLEKLTQKILSKNLPKKQKAVILVDYDKKAEDKLITALLYRFSQKPYNQIEKRVKKLNKKIKEKIIDEALKRLDTHARPLRELEHIYYTFDILIDYGAFRDIQRHRMCSQTNQLLTTHLGYQIPEEIIQVGFKKEFEICLEKSKRAFEKITKKFPNEASYVVCLAFQKRTLFTWNLRELFHFISLRTKPTGHFSYRKVAYQIWQEINKVHPLLAKYIKAEKP